MPSLSRRPARAWRCPRGAPAADTPPAAPAPFALGGVQICMRKTQLGMLVTGEMRGSEREEVLEAPFCLDPEHVGKSLQAVGEARVLMISKA